MIRSTTAFSLSSHISLDTLQCHLDSSFAARVALTERGKKVGDIIPRMSVQTSTQSLLIQVVGNQPNATTEYEETIENAHAEIVFSLFGAKGTTVAHEINKADGNAAINIQDQIVLFRRCHSLDSNGVVEHLARRESFLDEFFYELDSKIGVVARLDFMADAGDCVG
jgi:hypothetical protein